MHTNGLNDLLADTNVRRQGTQGILKDHADVFAAFLIQHALADAQQFAALEANAALSAGVAREKTHQGIQYLGFSCTGFTHNAKATTVANGETHIVDGEYSS